VQQFMLISQHVAYDQRDGVLVKLIIPAELGPARARARLTTPVARGENSNSNAGGTCGALLRNKRIALYNRFNAEVLPYWKNAFCRRLFLE